MMIAGKNIEWGQKRPISTYYFNTLKTLIRQALSELEIANIKTHNVSKSTDSIYFQIEFPGIEEIYTISLRTHKVHKVLNNYIYIYINNFNSLRCLVSHVQKKVVSEYRKLTNENVNIEDVIKLEVQHQQKKAHTNKPNKKLRKTTLRFNENSSLSDLMTEINGKPTEAVNTYGKNQKPADAYPEFSMELFPCHD